ncbi:hypothetical protein GCM10010912_22270 [Paenibacillus albidus]|uniref:Uncharacterized protein n=1 Tax=Paenibacillus albidus TaxID=2041023 RepID=A0A917FGB3_9BACL|nr:hypothetical protein [Paenibacillus albidus]GGF76707.1 hypothetical protein GCM10010912_22270 [Paenibacillus albidus]
MNLEQAEKIVNAYGAALASGKDGEMARKMSILPCDKETIIKAYKLFIAHLIEYRSFDEKTKDGFIVSLSGIGSFIEDENADNFNRSIKQYKTGMNKEYVTSEEYRNFMSNIVDVNLMEEIEQFISDVSELDEEDSLYHQRVYTLAGIEYVPEKQRQDLQMANLAYEKNKNGLIPNSLLMLFLFLLSRYTFVGVYGLWLIIVLVGFQTIRYAITLISGIVLLFLGGENRVSRSLNWKTTFIMTLELGIDFAFVIPLYLYFY